MLVSPDGQGIRQKHPFDARTFVIKSMFRLLICLANSSITLLMFTKSQKGGQNHEKGV